MAREKPLVDNLRPLPGEPPLSQHHYIPVPRERIVAALLAETPWASEQAQAFQQFARLYTGIYVLRLHHRLQSLKRMYEPFDPDVADAQGASPAALEQLLDELHTLLVQANFRELSREDISRSLESVSPTGLEVGVDLGDFAELRLYSLGEEIRHNRSRHWRSLWLREKTEAYPVFQRLVLAARFKSYAERVAEVETNGNGGWLARRRLRLARAGLPEAAERGCAFLRLFKDIPRSDLETLFPNRRVRMRRGDKIKLGITSGGGTASGVAATFTKLAAAASPVAIAGAMVGLAAVIFRQVTKVINQRTRYMMVLTRSLYFHCLDNNFGVISRLVDAALEEESKEVLLAYYFLLHAPPETYDEEQLDRTVEDYVRARFDVTVDFDVADGVRKLTDDGLLHAGETGKLKVVGLVEALALLQDRWRGYAQQAEL